MISSKILSLITFAEILTQVAFIGSEEEHMDISFGGYPSTSMGSFLLSSEQGHKGPSPRGSVPGEGLSWAGGRGQSL